MVNHDKTTLYLFEIYANGMDATMSEYFDVWALDKDDALRKLGEFHPEALIINQFVSY